ncbi:nucleic acid-binding, OB-fold protein [Tanacetum coccineum]
MSATTITSLRIGQENCILEAKVYRRWISKSVPDMKALAYCCILIDREATMDINKIDYFSQLIQPHAAYKISDFICERTKPYQQTLQNQITLKFGKITVFEPLPGKESEFPDHHFELISYYQLPSRVPYRDENSKLIYPVLTDYLGRIRSISDIMPFQTSIASQKYLRKVDIEDLDGNIVEFTMWDELAAHFDKKEIEKLTPPIIIAVSSCRVTRYKGTFRYSMRNVAILTCNNNNPIYNHRCATHYYINPHIAEAKRVYTIFKEKYNSNPPLQIAKYRCQDPEEEKIRNRQTLHTLLQQNPSTFKGVHFTCEAMITGVQENREWKYPSCSECSKASNKLNSIYVCEDHGKQDPVTYRYKFKAAVTDGTATTQFTFFTKAGEKITGHPCSQVAQKYKETDEQRLPTEIVNIIGKRRIFQIRYTPSTQRGAAAFVADDVLDIQPTIQTEASGTAIAATSATPSKETAGKEKHVTATPPHDLIEEVAEQEKEQSTNAGTTTEPKASSAKRSLLSELSSSTKKRKED